jgi:hypothetical protein
MLTNKNGIEAGDQDSRHIVYDPELMAQNRAQYCRIPGEPSEMKNKGLVA